MLSQNIDFVKEQISFHASKAEFFDSKALKFPNEKHRADSHRKMMSRFQELFEFLVAIDKQPSRSTPLLSSKLGLTAEEVEGLPPELLEELSISESDKADFAILSIIEEGGGVLSLDKILIALYRKTGEINKRSQINSRIYRIVQKGHLFNVPSRKGVYSTRELTEQESAELT